MPRPSRHFRPSLGTPLEARLALDGALAASSGIGVTTLPGDFIPPAVLPPAPMPPDEIAWPESMDVNPMDPVLLGWNDPAEWADSTGGETTWTPAPELGGGGSW